MNAQDIFEKLISLLRASLSQTTLDTWFAGARGAEITDNSFTITVKDEFLVGMLKKRYQPLIEEKLYDLFSFDVKAEIITEDEFITRENAKKVITGHGGEYNANEFTFDQFVVGSTNRFAFAAAQSVAAMPAQKYNPLYIYGNSGLGKTHLMRAISYDILSRNPDSRILYVTGENFAVEMIESLRVQKMDVFRNKYRNLDLLLVDDFQFIPGKEQTEEEFFYTFEALMPKCQIVLTADRQPKEFVGLSDRIRTRFEQGLLADIQPPNEETRIAIIKNKAELLRTNIPDDVTNYIAASVTANIRQIEGTIKQLKANSELLGKPIDIEMAAACIRNICNNNPEIQMTPKIIVEEVAKLYGITEDNIRSSSRKREFLLPRQVAMYLLRQQTRLSTTEIGNYFGKDHTTAMHAIDRVTDMAKKDPDLKETIQTLISNLESGN